MNLKWENLFENRCPQCGYETETTGHSDVKCGHCGFFARKKRVDEIKNDIIARREYKKQKTDIDGVLRNLDFAFKETDNMTLEERKAGEDEYKKLLKEDL